MLQSAMQTKPLVGHPVRTMEKVDVKRMNDQLELSEIPINLVVGNPLTVVGKLLRV